jgi:hypothetical protein
LGSWLLVLLLFSLLGFSSLDSLLLLGNKLGSLYLAVLTDFSSVVLLLEGSLFCGDSTRLELGLIVSLILGVDEESLFESLLSGLNRFSGFNGIGVLIIRVSMMIFWGWLNLLLLSST